MRFSRCHPGPKGQVGFTLIEVLTTLAVLGASLSLVVPSLGSVVRSNRSATAINELVATLHVARGEAITRNARIAVCPSEDGLTCGAVAWDAGWIRFNDANGNYRADAGEEVLGAVPTLAGLRIRTDSFGQALAFGPSGRPAAPDSAAGGGDFTFCTGTSGDGAQVLVLSALGHPVLAKQRADGREPDCGAG
ncbi:MAG: GspH/FimT family pseudopilin [Gammaproteobacteria bacterium]